MAKKTESKPKEQTAVPAEAEDMHDTPAGTQEVSGNMQEIPETTGDAQEEARDAQEASGTESRDIDEILKDDAELVEEIPVSPAVENEAPPAEKILFYIRTVNPRTAIRSAPEYPMRGDNIVGTIDDKELYGITDVANGFGRLAGGTGWIMLSPDVVTRQG